MDVLSPNVAGLTNVSGPKQITITEVGNGFLLNPLYPNVPRAVAKTLAEALDLTRQYFSENTESEVNK